MCMNCCGARNTQKIKTETKEETSTKSEAPPAKKAKTENHSQSAHRVVTTLVAPPSATDHAAAGSSKQ